MTIFHTTNSHMNKFTQVYISKLVTWSKQIKSHGSQKFDNKIIIIQISKNLDKREKFYCKHSIKNLNQFKVNLNNY